VRVALAYSGGLDTSVAARWLAEEHGHEVVAVLVDVGQGVDREAVAARAAAAGAELRVVDARTQFVTGYCWPALFANALYEGKYPLVSALARPLMAATVVEVAREVGADAVAHGCTGKGNDQVRFETTFAALAPDLQVLAPVREAALPRDRALALAEAWGIPVSAEARRYSVDENLWGRTVECGPLEDPWAEPPADAFAITADPAAAPDDPEELVVGFESGVPVALDGEALDAVEVVRRVGEVAGRHGFGRVDMVENRLVGIKSRELYEVPAALSLILAHRDLEDLTLERELAHEKAGLERRWAELAYYGQWHGPLHASLRAFMASTQATVTGEVRLRFYKGGCRVMGRRSPWALYDVALATYDGAADRFDHHHAEGFVRLWSLPVRTWAARAGGLAPPVVGVRGGSPGLGPGETPAAIHRPPPGAPQASPTETPEAAPATGGLPSVETDREGGPPPAAAPTPPVGSAPASLWGGRFSEPPAPDAFAFTRSLGFDARLAPYEVRATRAHVEGLREGGLLSAPEAAELLRELDAIAAEVEAGTFPWSEGDEDVHGALERVLTERLGPLGARVHGGRSRNDLVAADLRMWVKDAASDLALRAEELAAALADRAEEHRDAPLPGYTHLQRAQPVLLAHHLLAHAFPLLRDADRLERAAASADVSPLGAGALAGSTLPIPVEENAARLGFSRSFENSMDAVADRDFALEFLAACAILAVHLSRLAEDVVVWSSSEFGFARPAEAHVTGSSMMPQKRNPDVAELVRGKAGRVLGDLVALATVLKGLPLAYNRDLQEDKEPLFDAHDTLASSLAVMTALVRGLSFDREAMRAAVGGDLYATDVAEHLVAKGVPFREAHRLVGGIVADLEREGRTLTDVRPEEWSRWSPLLGPEVSSLLTPDVSVERRVTAGSTSPKSVDHQLAAVRARLRRSSRGGPPPSASELR
jgi:argininosuccinate lyase/argininosuccinate synthase